MSSEVKDGGARAVDVAEVIRLVRASLATAGWTPRRSGELKYFIHIQVSGYQDLVEPDVDTYELVFDTHYASYAGRIWVDVHRNGSRGERWAWDVNGVGDPKLHAADVLRELTAKIREVGQ